MSQVTRIASAFDTLSATALVTSGLTAFGTSALLLVVGRESVSAADLATFALLLVAWLGALAIRRPQLRALVQSAIGVGLLLSPLVLRDASGGAWVSVTTIGFAVIIGAAFTLPIRGALAMVGIVALAEAWVIRTTPPAAIFAAGEPLDGLIGPVLAVTAGSGLVLAIALLKQQGQRLDDRQGELEIAQERAERESRLQRAQESVERRVHETVLNTLSGIAMGNITAEAAQRAALRDLEQVELGIQPMDDSPVEVLVDAAIAASGISGVDISSSVSANPVVSGRIATALRDSLVEALRNVDRHASARTVRITVAADSTGSLEVTVTDDGRGMSPATRENFGIRSALRRSIESVGGRVEIQSVEGSGTTIVLLVPALEPLTRAPALPDWQSLLASTRWGRIGLAGTGVFLAIVAVPLAMPFAAAIPMAIAMLLFAALTVVLAIRWTDGMRRIAPLAGIALIAIVVWFAVRGEPDGVIPCTAAAEVPWIISGMSGGGSLLLLTCYRSIAARTAVLMAVGGVTIVFTLGVVAECRGFPTLTTLVNIGYMAAIVGYLSWLDIRFDVVRRRSLDLWQQVTAADADLRARDVAMRRWNRLTAGVATLLRGIARGDLDPAAPAVQARAATEAGALRARLGQQPEINAAWADLEREATRAALESGVALDRDIVAPWTCMDPLPDWVTVVVRAAIERSAPRSVRLAALTDGGCDEAILVLPSAEAMRAALDAVPTSTGDWEVRPEDGTRALVLRRCATG